MADEEINGDTDDIQHDKDKTQKKTAKHDSGVADLEKVTDYAEEMEISSQDISGVSIFVNVKNLFLNKYQVLKCLELCDQCSQK